MCTPMYSNRALASLTLFSVKIKYCNNVAQKIKVDPIILAISVFISIS